MRDHFTQTQLAALFIFGALAYIFLFRRKIIGALRRKPYTCTAAQEHTIYPADELRSITSGLTILAFSMLHILEETDGKPDKERLLSSFKMVLVYYMRDQDIVTRSAINQYIIRKCRRICEVDFTENELEALWSVRQAASGG